MSRAYQIVEKYRIEAKTTAPLHVGTGGGEDNDVLVHPVTDTPFIQASSIAGVLRTISEELNGMKGTEELFGRPNQEGDPLERGSAVRISDAEMKISSVKMEYRPRVRIDPFSGTAGSGDIAGSGNTGGHKFNVEFVGSGARFVFYLYLFYNPEDHNKDRLENVLRALKSGYAQFGGQKTNGAGFISIDSIKYCCFDLTKAEGRKKWAKEAFMDDDSQEKDAPTYDDELDDRQTMTRGLSYVIEVRGKTEGALLVKGNAADGVGKDTPDAVNMQDSAGRYIVPGSAIKGTIRNRMTYISKYLNKEGIIPKIFGKSGNEFEEGTAGGLIFKDMVMGANIKRKRQYRIHIDKFTGGVMQGGLFSEEPLSGDISIKILVGFGGNKELADAAAGLLILALRDLGAGMFNIGSGYSIGRGFIDIEKVKIRTVTDQTNKGRSEEIDFRKKDGGKEEDHSGSSKDSIVRKCLLALSQWEAKDGDTKTQG